MTTYQVDRCQVCKTTIHLDWDVVACPCGAVLVCSACDEIEACDECRANRNEGDDE